MDITEYTVDRCITSAKDMRRPERRMCSMRNEKSSRAGFFDLAAMPS